MDSNNIGKPDLFGITYSDSFEERIVKILNPFKHWNVSVFPIVNECKSYSTEDCSLKLTSKNMQKKKKELLKFQSNIVMAALSEAAALVLHLMNLNLKK